MLLELAVQLSTGASRLPKASMLPLPHKDNSVMPLSCRYVKRSTELLAHHNSRLKYHTPASQPPLYIYIYKQRTPTIHVAKTVTNCLVPINKFKKSYMHGWKRLVCASHTLHCVHNWKIQWEAIVDKQKQLCYSSHIADACMRAI